MTVCIAANCAGGHAVVVASDRMLSAPFLTLEFDHPDAKINQIGQACVALTAGDALAAQEVLSNGPGLAGQLQDPLIAHFAEHVRKCYVEARRKFATERILEPRGMSFEEFYQQGGISRLPHDLAFHLDGVIQSMSLEVSIILAGVDGLGAHIFGIDDPGRSSCFDRLGYHAIGSGHRHALLSMVVSGQHISTSLNKTVFNVYASKRSAEVAPGVGQATEVRIISKTGVRALSTEELDSLKLIYDQHVNPKNDTVQTAIKALPFDKGTHDETDDSKKDEGGPTTV